MKIAAGGIFLEILLILVYSPLKSEVAAAAVAEGATSLDTTLNSVFPYLWVFLIFALAGVIVYAMVLKK